MGVSSHGEAGQQVTGLPVGAGCTEALLLQLVAAPVGGPSAASSVDLCRDFRGGNLCPLICVV